MNATTINRTSTYKVHGPSANRNFGFVFVMCLSFLLCAIAEQPERSFSNKIPDADLVYETSRATRAFYGVNDLHDPQMSFLEPYYYSDSQSGTEAFIGSSRQLKIIYVIFRGSDEAKDWRSNLKISKSTLGPIDKQIPAAGRVHSGYNDGAFAGDFYENSVNIIKEKGDKSYAVVIAGHSKGGAEAVLFASYLAEKDELKKNIFCITFGQPKVGDEGYQSWIRSINNLSLWTFVLADDPVPRLPLSLSHVGHLVQLDENEAKAYYEHEGNEKLGLLGTPFGWDFNISPGYEIHLLKNYVKYFRKSSRSPRSFYVDHFEERTKAETCPWYRLFC